MPLNGQLIERGARLVEVTKTSSEYKLFVLPDSVPPKPGLLRVPKDEGHPITIELWDMPLAQYGSFVALIPAPLGIGTLTLMDGRQVQGFVCESLAVQGALDISHLGGWRAYIQSLS
jgi:allophanate hydrolase